MKKGKRLKKKRKIEEDVCLSAGKTEKGLEIRD